MQSAAGWGKDSTHDLNGKRRIVRSLIIVIITVLLVFSSVLVFRWFVRHYAEDGSRIVSAGNLSVAEARASLDDETQRNRITVSIAPVLQWDEQDESLAVNFIVAPGNNGYSERFEIEQDDRVVYSSEVIEPEHAVGHIRVTDVHEGIAIVTVYAVDSEGRDRGSPVSVETQIVGKD